MTKPPRFRPRKGMLPFFVTLPTLLGVCCGAPGDGPPPLKAAKPLTDCTEGATSTGPAFSLDVGFDDRPESVTIFKTTFKDPYLARWGRSPEQRSAQDFVWAVASDLLVEAVPGTKASDIRDRAFQALASHGIPPAALRWNSLRDDTGELPLTLLSKALENSYVLRLNYREREFEGLARSGALLKALPALRQALASMARVEPNFIYFAVQSSGHPSDTYFSDQLAQLLQIEAPRVWADGHVEKKDMLIAITDTGIACDHPDLKKNIARDSAGKPIGASTYSPHDDPCDSGIHGTICAGIFGAEGDNDEGIAGINWRISIVPAKFIGPNNCGSAEDGAAAILFAAGKAHIVSASWGGLGPSTTLKNAIAKVDLFVTAAGNNGWDIDQPKHEFYPASFGLPNMLVAGAVDSNNITHFNFGKKSVHLSAPGVGAVSTTVNQGMADYASGENGTSISTAFVAGAAALLKAEEPSLGYDEIKALLIKTTRPFRALLNASCSGGVLDLKRAFAKDTQGYVGSCPP
jgi:subtilisin family serine protease